MGEQLPVVQKKEPVVQQSDGQMGVQGNKAGLSMQESCSEISNIFYAAKKNCSMRILSSDCSDLTLISQPLSFTTTLKNRA